MVRRLFVEKKPGFDVEAHGIFTDLTTNLQIEGLARVRFINRYDVEGMQEDEFNAARGTIFSEPPVDIVWDETFVPASNERVIAIEYLPGQYDQRADSAAQCVSILTEKDAPRVANARLIILVGQVSDDDFLRARAYLINPVECREAAMTKPSTLDMVMPAPENVRILENFTAMDREALAAFAGSMGFAMTLEDLIFCQNYFRDTEKRNPTVTEIRMIDTYWSDHCRHTTFLTEIRSAAFAEGAVAGRVRDAYAQYLETRKTVLAGRDKPVCLMDIAVLGMREMKMRGLLEDLDVSDEINACSIVIDVDVDGVNEEWLLMFKNETHNHPTEIEPFGGAATCLGGAIRDPLSGRSYVYQAMRVTGSADPRATVEETLAGKLPQRKISTGAAAGYSSYGNQIGLATGQVAEIYDPGYMAKRMEIGAVIAAAPRSNVVRKAPVAGDIIVLLGGRTGRDGCGGATGSSKEHTEESLASCGAEVQKGNPPTERKIQRLFRHPACATLIKKCNDFGAGGISVAIGELADGLVIDLDKVPRKYEGLDGTELAISESQERMAVVLDPKDVEAFIALADEENLEAVAVAVVTEERRLRMNWRGQAICDISRDFLDTNGVSQEVDVFVADADLSASPLLRPLKDASSLSDQWTATLQDLNVCSQKGLVERFDSTIGAGTVLMPFGGARQLSPLDGMVAKIPVLHGETDTASFMTYGFNASVASWSPYHGAVLAVTESLMKLSALGADWRKARLTLQEYFEKPGREAQRWGKPFAALLGAWMTQSRLGVAAIGGKDSMSGTFKDLTVPPTLVSFAVAAGKASKAVSGEFTAAGLEVVMLTTPLDAELLPETDVLAKTMDTVSALAAEGKLVAARTVKAGGLAEAVSKMAFGNFVGLDMHAAMTREELFRPGYGSVVLVLAEGTAVPEGAVPVGVTLAEPEIRVAGEVLTLEVLCRAWEQPLAKIFPEAAVTEGTILPEARVNCSERPSFRPAVKIARPKVIIPVFPGTNCEYDTARAFSKAGADAEIFVFRNLTAQAVEESISALAAKIRQSQMVMLPGGFSGGDEPDGSGKFIATAFRNPLVRDAVMDMLKNRDGLMLGICNGFQALIKLGLATHGEIIDMEDDTPTLTFNTIGRHISCMVQTRVASVRSPWLANTRVGDLHTVAMSHGEGRFAASAAWVDKLAANGQVAFQYVDLQGQPTMDGRFNPNGSVCAIEGIVSPDGRILGKMGHSERIGGSVIRNVPGIKDQGIFAAGVSYFID